MGSIRGVTSLSLGTGSATVTIALPAGTVVGDVLVVVQGSAWAIASSIVPPGWTFADLIVGSDCNGAAFYRPATVDIVGAGSISYVNDNGGAGVAHLYALTGFYPVSAKWSVRVTNGGNSTSAAFTQAPANLYLYAAAQKIATPLPTISRGSAQGTPFTGPTFSGLTKSETGVTAAGQTVAFGHSTGGFAATYDVVLEAVPAAVGFTSASLSASLVGSTSARISWPIINDGVLSYDVRADGGAATNVAAAASYLFTGLSSNASHTLQVREVYAGGPGPYATITVRTPAVVYVLDDFNRADSTSSLGTPYEGGPYTVRTGTWGLIAGQGYTSAALAGAHATFPAAVDVDVQATFPAAAGSAFGNGLIVRWVDASNFWYFGTSASATPVWTLFHSAAGTLTQYATGPNSAAGDVARLVAVGRNLYGLVNGKLVAWWEDQFFSAATAVAGIRLNNSTAVRIDNLSAVPGVPPGDGATSLVFKGRDTAVLDAGSVA